MKKYRILYLIFALFFIACGGGNTNLGFNYNTGKIDAKAKLGRLSDAKVEIYEIENDGTETLKWEEKTSKSDSLDDIGKFNSHINELSPNRLYLYEVIGGENWDVDEDGKKDSRSTTNKGVLRALANGRDFKKAGEYFNVTVASEMLYESVAKYYKYFDSQKLNESLVSQSKDFVKDIDNDAKVDMNDILTFNPVTDRDRLVSLYNIKLPKIILLEIDSILGHIDTGGVTTGVTLFKDGIKAYIVMAIMVL